MQISVRNKRQSMQKKLFGYMFILAIVLLLILAAFLFLFGRFSTTEDKISDILSLQIEFFDREMTSYYNDITLRGAQLSEKAAQLTEKYKELYNFFASHGEYAMYDRYYGDFLSAIKLHTKTVYNDWEEVIKNKFSRGIRKLREKDIK